MHVVGGVTYNNCGSGSKNVIMIVTVTVIFKLDPAI